jgi:hypothetical protein
MCSRWIWLISLRMASPEPPMSSPSGVMTRHLMNTDISFGFEIPSQLRPPPPNNGAAVIVNGSNALVVGVGGGGSYRALMFRKSDKTWHTIPQCCGLTGFGRFIAVNEISIKAAEPTAGSTRRTGQTAETQPLAESAGKSEWRSKEKSPGAKYG